MGAHRFKVGDLVRVGGPVSLSPVEHFLDQLPRGLKGSPATGIGEVVQVLPEVDGELQYRVRTCADFRERIVRERQLQAAVRASTAPAQHVILGPAPPHVRRRREPVRRLKHALDIAVQPPCAREPHARVPAGPSTTAPS